MKSPLESSNSALVKANQKALQRLNIQANLALEYCRTVTGGNVLTSAEYATASAEFQELIATPYAKGEPIYIMPPAHEKVEAYAVHIKNGTPYHQFITDNYGIVWPIVLRLYYEKHITIEQMETMLKLSYWQETELKVETVPLFEGNGQLSSWEGVTFIQGMHFPRDKQFFIRQAATLPSGEKCLFKVKLNHDYINFARLYPHLDMLDVVAQIAEVPACTEKYHIKMLENAASLFGALAYASEWPHQIICRGTELFLLLPSSSLVKTYLETMNPERSFQYKRRLGNITPEMMEAYSEQNMRVGNLFAPGVTGPRCVHQKISLPVLIVEHDMYHAYFEGLLSVQNYAQMMRAKQVLRQVFSTTDQRFTSEIMRCIERERKPNIPEQQRFLELLKYVFLVDQDGEDSELHNSSVIILCDIFLNPQYWPYSVNLKKQLLDLLYPGKNKPSLQHWERAIQRYASLVHQDVAVVAMLALCHFDLRDDALALALANHSQQSNPLTQIEWMKNEKKHLQPVFKRENIVYTLKTIRAWSPAQRIEVLAPSLYYLESTADLPAIITAQGGKICSQQLKRGYLRFSIPCYQLNKGMREQLGCDRVRVANMRPAQRSYLQKSISSITFEADQTGGILCTFPKRYRPLVTQVITQWYVLQQQLTQVITEGDVLQQQKCIHIQHMARAYLKRKGFYTQTPEKMPEDSEVVSLANSKK